jgi:electron transfer flavoprotein beta subunit
VVLKDGLMRVLVPAKRVVDANVKISLKPDGSGVDCSTVKMGLNPFDEIAVEEAVRLKERGLATEVLVASIGPVQCLDTIRTALAMGADRGIHVHVDTVVEPLGVAKVLKYLVERERIDLVIAGKQAIDDDCNQTGQMLAALLKWPQATFAAKIDVNDRTIVVTRESDGGQQVLALNLPAVVTADLRLNEPRYASLPNIMKARRIPIESLTPEDIGIELAPRLIVLRTIEPTTRPSGKLVSSVSELLGALNERGDFVNQDQE